jgi:hypothetical protein
MTQLGPSLYRPGSFRHLLSRLDDRREHLVTIVVQQAMSFIALSILTVLFANAGPSSLLFWEAGLAGTLLFLGWSMYRYEPTRAEVYSGVLVTDYLTQLVATLAARSDLSMMLRIDGADLAVLRGAPQAELDWAAAVTRLSGYAQRRPSALTRTLIGLAFFALGAYLGAWLPTQFPGLATVLESQRNPLAIVIVPLLLGSAGGLAYRLTIAALNRQSVDALRARLAADWDNELVALAHPRCSLRLEALWHHLSVAATVVRVGRRRGAQLAALGVDVPNHRSRWSRARSDLSVMDDHTLSLLQLSYGIYLSLVLPPLLGFQVT